MKNTLFVYHPECVSIKLGNAKDEDLLEPLFQYLQSNVFNLDQVFVKIGGIASETDVLRVHTKEYINKIIELEKSDGNLDEWTPVPRGIFRLAKLTAEVVIDGCEFVFNDNVRRAAMINYLGDHHAGRNFGGGYCFLNSGAIAISRLIEKNKVRRVLIFDLDGHHGNGTQDIFYDTSKVLYISFHQDPRTIYPGTGFINEIGSGDGKGFNVNLPLAPQSSDLSFTYGFNELARPLIECYKPDFIFVDAGVDGYVYDPETNLRYTTLTYDEISKNMIELAERFCEGRIGFQFVGGYNKESSKIASLSMIKNLIDTNIPIVDPYKGLKENRKIFETNKKTVERLKNILKDYWSCF